jgi:hypothetical protein
MEMDRKVISAIGAAVTAYLEEERAEEAVRPQIATPAATLRLWGQMGRQEIMRNRQLWQMKIVPRR